MSAQETTSWKWIMKAVPLFKGMANVVNPDIYKPSATTTLLFCINVKTKIKLAVISSIITKSQYCLLNQLNPIKFHFFKISYNNLC